MNTQDDKQVSGMNNAPAQHASVGRILREAREQLGLSVNDVANRIKFAPRQIEYLEEDDFVRLPEAAFVRGFVRSYARLLELDPVKLLSSLPMSHVQASTTQELKSVDIPMPSAFSARRHNVIWLAAALVVALSLAIFERVHDRSPAGSKSVVKNSVETVELPNVATDGASAPLSASTEEAEQPAQEEVKTKAVALVKKPAPKQAEITESKPKQVVRATPEVVTRQPEVQKVVRSSPPVAEINSPLPPQNTVVAPTHGRVTPPAATEHPKVNSETPATEHALRIELDEDAWVEVKDSNDKLLISKMHRAGSLIRVAGKSPMQVTLGNARAVRLFDNGKRIKLERYTTAEVAKVKIK